MLSMKKKDMLEQHTDNMRKLLLNIGMAELKKN